METEVNILEDASAVHTELEDRHSLTPQYGSTSNECAPAGSIVNQTLTKMSENENEHKKPVEIKDVETGSDKNEVINDFNVEEHNHDIANDATKISKLLCAEEPKVRIHEEETSTDIGSFDQHFEVITNEHANLEVISESMEKEIITFDKDGISRSKGEKDSDLEECGEQATSMPEANLGERNEALLPTLDLATKNQGEDDVRVVDSCIKDEDIDNKCSNKSIHVEVEGKDIESFRSSNKLENEHKHDKIEDASINVTETPHIHQGEEATPEAASNNEDDNNNKLQNQPSELATDEVSTLGVALEAEESLKETSSEACAEIKKDILDSKWQDIEVPPVDEINKAEDSALLNSNEGGENGEDIDQIGLTETNEDRKINPEKDDGDKRGSWQQNEQQEKLGGDFVLIPEKSEISATGENVEMSTEKLHPDYEEKEEKEEPASTSKSEETLSSTERNLPLVESITKSESAEIEFPEKNGNDLNSEYLVVEKTRQEDSGETGEVKTESQEENQESSKPHADIEGETEFQSEAQSKDIVSKDNNSEGAATKEIILQSNEDIEEHGNVLESSNSDEKIEIKDGGKIIPDKAKEREEDTDSQTQKTSTESVSEDEAPIRDRTIEQSFQGESPRDSEPTLIDDENHKPENEETINKFPVNEKKSQNSREGTSVEVEEENNVSNLPPEFTETVNELECDKTVAVSKHVEVVTDMNSENAVQEEKELAERTEEISEVAVVEREGQEETTVTLERISQKENIEENVKTTDDTKENEAENQEVCERPKTDASESKTEDKEIDNTVESGTLPSVSVGIEKGENESCETRIKEEVEATITNISDDFSINNSEAPSLEDVTEKPALTEVKSLNEEQLEASDASSDLKDFTTIETTANSLGSVEIDERKEQTDTDAKRDVEVPEVTDEAGLQISHDITDQALTTSRALSEIQLDQTFVDSDMVPSKEDPQTIEISKTTDKTVAGDDASYVHAETPFIAHFEVSADNKKENADEETDQKNTVEDQPITQREKEQVIVLADHNEANKLQIAADEKSTVEVSKHIEVDTSTNSENVALEGEVLAERTEESSAVVAVERVGQEETTATLERISQKENVEDKVKAIDDTKENESANQETFNDLQHDRTDDCISSVSNQNVESTDEDLDISLKKQEETVLGEFKDNDAYEDKDAKTEPIHEEYSMKTLQNDEKEKVEEFADITTEGSKADALGENLKSTEFTAEEETTTTHEEISQKEEREEKIKSIDDDTKETELENQEVQVFVTTEESQATAENIVEENNNKLVEISTSTLGVSEKYECSTNDSEAALLGDVSEKPATKGVKSVNEEKPEISDASPDMTDLTTIETKANSLSSVDIDEMKEKETDTEEKRDMEVPVVAEEGAEQISHDIKDQALTTGTPLLEVQLEQTFVDSDMVPSKEEPETIDMSKTTDKTIAGDDVSYTDADTAFIAHVKGSSDNKKNNADEEIDEKNTVEDQPIEQKEREQVIVLADQNEANELEIDKDEKSIVEVSKHVEVESSMNSESAVLEEEELAERTEDSSAVVVVEREGQEEETTATLERISHKENIEEKVTATEDTKENEAASQEHDRTDDSISSASNQNVESPDEDLDISLKKQEVTVLGEFKDNDAYEDKDAKIEPIHEEYSNKMLQNDEKEKVEDFADTTTEGSKADASGENLESTEFTAEEETTTTQEEISRKEEIEEKIKSMDDDTKENESENQEMQVFVTTEESQATAENILEVCEKSKIDASESKPEDREIENTVGSGTLSSVSVDTEKGKEFPEENESNDTKMKEEVEETSLTETKVTDTLDNFSEPKEDNDPLTTEENNNRLVEISTSTLGVSEKYEYSTNDSEAVLLGDVSDKPATKEVKSINEEKPEISDASPDMTDLTTIETKTNSLSSVDIDEMKEKETDTEEKRDMEVPVVAEEGAEQISHDIKDQALTTGTPLLEVQLEQTFVDSDMVLSKEEPETIDMSKTTDKTIAGDDVSYIDADTAFVAHVKGSSDNKKNNADEEIDEKNTVEDQPIEQKEREQVIVLADQNEANELEIDKDEKSIVEVSKHVEVESSMNSESAVLEEEKLAERTEDSSAVVVVKREGQEEETTATLERISHKESIEEKETATDDTKENEAASQETFNDLQHDRTDDSISSASNQNVESPDEVLDISLKKQEETVLGEFKDNDADEDKDAKIEPIHEEYSNKMLQNDEKEKVEDFADTTTEGSKADASGENLESTEFTAEEETTTTQEEISQKEEREEKITSIDDDTKENESENQVVQVLVTTEESQATAENILEVCEKSKIDASESKPEDREIENTVGSGTWSSVSVDTEKGKEFPQENESGDTKMKEELEETSLSEPKVTDTLDNFSEPKEDNDALTTEENNNKLVEISTNTLGVSEKYDYSTNDSEAVLLGDVSEKPATKEVKSINEEKPEICDAFPDMSDLTTIETKANSLRSVGIDEMKEKETDTEEKRDMEVPVVADEGGEQISHDIKDQALTTGTPLSEVQLEPTFEDSDMVLSKEDPETIETSKTTDKTIVGDDVPHIDADTVFVAHVKMSSDNEKDNADEEIDEKNTVEDQPIEQKEREQVIVLADQNEANELEIDKDEKSTVEVSRHVEVVGSMNSESVVLEEEELAERTEDSSAVVVVEREGQEESTSTLERIPLKENIEEKVTATDDTKENEAASQEALLPTTVGSEATEDRILMVCEPSKAQASEPKPEEVENTVGTLSLNSVGTGTGKEYPEENESDETMMKKEVEVMKAESENQTEATNLMDRNVSNASDDIPEPKEDHGASTNEQNNHNVVENSSSISEVFEKDDNNTNGSESEALRVVSENTSMNEGHTVHTEYKEKLKGFDAAAPDKKDVTTVETKEISSSSFNNDERQEEESSSENVPEVVEEIISHEARTLEICKDENPTVEVSKYAEVSTGVKNESALLEEEELSERTDRSPAPAVIGEENEAAEPKAGSPSCEEEPAISKNSELLIEKSLQSDESERSKLAEDKDKDATIKLRDNFTNANDREEKVEDFPDINSEGSKEETKITVEKISQMEEIEEKEVRSIDDTEETEAANQEIPVTDATGQATGENNLKVCETSNTEASVSKPQEEEIENIDGTFPSASIGMEAGKQHPHVDTDDTKLQQEVEVTYVESTEQIEAKSFIERKTSNPLDNYSEPKEDHGSLKTEENKNNLVDNASPTAGILEEDESNITDSETEFLGVTSDKATMKGDKIVHEDQPEWSDAATRMKDITSSAVSDERQEEESNSEENRNIEVLKVSDEGLQQVSHDIEEKSEITGPDHEKESTISIPQSDEQLAPTAMDSSMVPSKEELETIKSSKTIEDTPARDDEQEKTDGRDQKDKDKHDHMSPDLKTKNDISDTEDIEQLKREQISGLEDQNEALEVEIVKDEKSVGEVLKLIEDATCIKGEETVLEEGEYTERTEDSPAATGVEEKPADLKEGIPISEEDAAPDTKDITATETKADCSGSVNNDDRQEEESNLEENRNIEVPKVVEESISHETDLTISTPLSDDQLVHTFMDSSQNDPVPIENSDEGVDKVVDETSLHELKTEDNISGTDATEKREEEQVFAVSSDQNEACKLEICKDETPTVEVSKYNEVSTSRNDENALLEEEELAERTDEGPEVIGVENEAAEQQAGSPGSEEGPAITKSSELLNEKSLQSDESDRSGPAEDKDKDAEIKLKREEYSKQMPQNNGEEKVEEFADMNYECSKADTTTEYSERTTCTSEEETKIIVEKISQEEEIEEKVRSIDDTKDTEAAKQETPVSDGASQATGENKLKVSETLNAEASISKPQEEIENMVGTFSSASVAIEAEKEYTQAHADETKLKQEVEVKYAESTEQIEATLDNASEPKEDHGALTTEANNNNLVDNDSPSTGVFEKDENNINDSETQFLGVTGDNTIMKDNKQINEDQLEGSDIATQTKDVTTIEREEEGTNSEENKSTAVPQVADEGLQQESHQLEEKAEIASLDHVKESTISTPQLDEQLVQTNVESSMVPSKEEPETTEPSNTAEDNPARDEEKEREDGRDQKHKDQDEHMPLDLKTENDILDREDKEQLKKEKVSGLEDQNEARELEIVKDEQSSVEASKDIEVVTCITSKNVVLEEEELAARIEDNSAVAGVEREAAELKERTPSSEEELAGTKSSELLAAKIYVTDGASQATGENNSKVSETSNTDASVSKPQEEEIENFVVTSPASVGIEAGKEYPQVHTDETKLPQKLEVTYAELFKEQMEATSLIERKFSSTLDNISELILTTEESNSNLVDNASPTAKVFEKDESNITDSETEFLSVTSDKTILKDDKPVNEDQLEGSDAATQTKDVTIVETKNSSSVSDERQEEETNSEENKSMEVAEVADEGLQMSHHIEEKAEITGLDHEKESTASTPQLDKQLVQTEIDSNMVPLKDGPETIESSKTTEKSNVEVSKDIEVVTSTNDETIVVEDEELAKRTEGNSAVAGVEREVAELKEGTPSSEEPAQTKSSELQVEKVDVTYEESKEQNEATFLMERKNFNTLDDLSEPKEDDGALTAEENNVDLVDNSSTSAGVSEKDENNTNESSKVPSKEEAETIESSKATEDTTARDEEKEREDGGDQKHKDKDEHMPSDLRTENDIFDREDIEQLKREQISGLEDQNESSELEIVKDEKSSVEVSKDIEVVTCINNKNVLEEEEIAARTEDNSVVVGVEREVAEVKEGTPISEEEPAKTKTSKLLAEKVEITYEDNKPVNEDQAEVCDATTHTRDVTNIETEANSSIVYNDERQEEETNSEENRNTEVPEVKDDGGPKMSHEIKEKDVITCTDHEKESTISTPHLDEQLVQTYTDSSVVPSKEDQELIGSSKTTEEIAARDEKSTSLEISEGASILVNSDNEKQEADGGDQKHKDQDQIVSPDQKSKNDISDAEDIKQWKTEQGSGLADQNETPELEIIKDEKSVGEVLKQIEDATCIKGEETVLKEEQHIERAEDSPGVIKVKEEPAELKGGSPINEEDPTITKNSELLPEKVRHTVETADNGSIKEELMDQSIITAEEEEGSEVQVLDSELKQHNEATELTEEKESITLEDHTKQNINIIDISSLTSADVSETSNKDSSSISKVYEREAAAEVLKKDEPIIDDDTKHVSVTVAIEETGLKNAVPEHEEQCKGSDFAIENESETTILTQTTILNDKDIHERQEENFSMEKKGILEEVDESHLKTDHCVEETEKSTSVQHEREVTTSSVLNFEDHPHQLLEENDTYAPEITDKAEETHVSEHTTENKLLQNELDVTKQDVYEVESEKSNASENILEKTPEPESNATESDAVSAVDNTVTEVNARNSESIKQIENLKSFAKANDDVISLTTIEALADKTCGEESKQTLLRDSDNERQKADGEDQKQKDQDELMPPDLKSANVISGTEDIEQWRREQVSGLADQNEACELEPVKVEMSTVEVPKDVVTSTNGKDVVLEEQDLAERAEENSAVVGVEREAAELKEGTLSCEDEPVETKSSELLTEKLEVAYEESKKQKGALDDLPEPKEDHDALTTEEKNDNLVDNSSPPVGVLEKDENSTNDSDNATVEDDKPVNKDQVEVSDAATETKDVTTIETEAHSISVNNDERQEEATVNSKEDQGSIGSNKTTEETAARDDSSYVDTKTGDEKSVDEVSKHIEDATCIKGEEIVPAKDEHTGRTEDSPIVTGVEVESAELKEGSPISEEEPTNTKSSEVLVEKVHHTVETADNANIKEELMECSIISAEEEGGIEVRVSNSELKQHIEATELTEEIESVTLEDHTEASETCNKESSSVTKVYEREAEAEVLKKDEPTTDDDTKHASVTVAIEETGSKDVAPEYEEQDKGSDFATENESVTTITTESTVLNDKDIHERQEEDSSMEKKGILEEDDCYLKTDYCVEETEKTSTRQHEREVTTSLVLNSQEYPQQPLEEKDTYVTEEITDKAAETYLTEHTTENKLLQHECEVAKLDVYEVETEKSNAGENILEQTTEPESKVRDAVSSTDNIVNEVIATDSESIKQIESLENFSKANEDVSSFATLEASQEETHGEESKKTLFRTSSLESREAEKDTEAEIIKKDDASNIAETLPRTLVGEDTRLNETIGEDKKENNFVPATEARDVTSTDTVNSRLVTINTDAIQEKSSCSEKNGEKQSPEIADGAVQEMHEDIRDKAPPKGVEHEGDSSLTPILHDNLQSSLVTQAEEGSFTNAESPFVVHTMEEKLTESNPDVVKPEVSADLGAAIIEKESEDKVIQKHEDEDIYRPHIVNNQTNKSDTKDAEITRTEEDSSLTAQSEACTLRKGEEPCIEALKHRTDGTFTDDEKVAENLRSSLKIIEGREVAAALDLGGQGNNHDSTKIEKSELSAEKDHLIQDSTSEYVVKSILRQQFPSEKEGKIEIESEVEHHLNIPSNEKETLASSLTTEEVHGGFDRAGGNESNDNIKEQIVDSEVRLMELQISSARNGAADEVKDSNLSSTETLKAEDSNKQTVTMESSIKEDHPTTKGAESATKALEEDIQNESSRRPTEVPIVALQVEEREMEKNIVVEEDNCFIVTHTPPVEVLQVESSPEDAQLDKALKRSDLDDQCPKTIKSLQAEEVIGVKDETASSSLIVQLTPKVHENVDACEQNLPTENMEVDEGEEFMRTYEVVSKDEIIDDKLLQMGDDEKLQNQTSASLERKQEQGIQVTSQKNEENSKAVETLDHNFSDSKTAEETCLEKEDSIKYIDHNSGTKIYEDSQMDSSSKSHKKGEAPDVILKPYEKGEKECIDSLLESREITEETKPEEASNLKTSEKAFEYVQEVDSDKAVIELEDREYTIKTEITNLQPEDYQSEKTIAAEKTTNTQVLEEKIIEEKEGGKIFLQNFISKTHQENEPEAVDPSKRMKETFQTINNDNQHEVKSEALKKDEVEVIKDKLPCDVEGNNITEAARLDDDNQDAEINVTNRILVSQSEEESGVKRSKEGHITEENENKQDITKRNEGSLGKTEVESYSQHNRKTNENVLQVPQIPNEDTTLEVLPGNAEPGRAIGIGIILEGTKVGEEKIRHPGDVLTKKSTSTDAEKTSVFNISEKSAEEPLEAAIHLDEATDKAVSTEKEKTLGEEIPHVEDDKSEVVSGATEIAKSSKDVDIKVARKKHHSILSGVGSKVKHSISKVKKAITGKSSHSKSSPK